MITFQGAGQPTTITGMRARVLSRTEALTGTVIVAGLGGSDEIVCVGMNLDDEFPAVDHLVSNIINIAADETVVVGLHATAMLATVTWDLEIDFVTAGKLKTVTVRSKDALLRTTPRAGCDEAGREPPGYSHNFHYDVCLYAHRERLEPWIDQPRE
ncbi:hypothetical protein WN71_034245 [Streptomyces mangrovisoli]|uniref:Uncharacterized protein n=1 Tax=Streptomyces mangrovisoli TaxID=1428628 RepID=A0A1J4NMC1_9ACTN|nr:hypothetical protein WN71_034245 [Streptomyces mangrovisoli]